ncbi:MAG: ATP-binding cassette domain-containing protein [Eubacteriales bacterium]|jgi:lincosamide and streptogramin A transport system ATP-binding/permease protein
MSYIDVQNLSFEYEDGGEEIFQDVSLHIDGSWKLGLIGRNGRGKTTFLNLLLGKLPYSGTIRSDLDFAYFPYEVADKDRMTLEILQEVSPGTEDWEFIRETSLLNVDAECLYRPFGSLSNGEQTKTLLAAMFAGENRFLLLDEPTNHVDADGREKIGAYLQHKQGFILVSHDRALLDSCVDHILSINRTNIDLQQGNFSSWWSNFQRAEQNELAENEKLKKEAARLSEAARQSSEWSDKVERSKKGATSSGSKVDRGFVGHKSAKMMQKAKNYERRMQAAADEKTKLLHNVETAETLELRPLSYPKHTLVTGKDIALYYGDTMVCGGINFEVSEGDRLVVAGKNGCGKSTLLKLICGEDAAGAGDTAADGAGDGMNAAKNIRKEKFRYTGDLIRGGGLIISYVPQSADFLSGTIREYAEQAGLDLSLYMSVLRKLGFERSQFDTRTESMSEGQKKKILIAASLCQSAHLYIWDEPINYIDVISRMQIEDMILNVQPTLIFVEHDRVFSQKIATRTLTLA